MAVDADLFGAEHINVPDDLGACGEVVGALLGQFTLGGGAVIIFAPNFYGEGRCSIEEFAAL